MSSRCTTDHATDVLTGSILGVTAAYFSYRQYYPSLATEYCERPYSPRVAREELLPLHRRSDSQSTPMIGGDGDSEYPFRDQEIDLTEGTVPRDEEGYEI